MEKFTIDILQLIRENYAVIFILLIPKFSQFLTSLKEFVTEMKKLSKETHIILKKCDERLSALEQNG